MKIGNFLNPQIRPAVIQTKRQASTNPIANLSLRGLSQDAFVKNTSFAGRATFDTLYSKYVPRIIYFALNAPKVTLEEAENIINAFSPDAKVCDLQDLETKVSPHSSAVYEQGYEIPYKKGDPTSKIIFLNPQKPADGSFENRIFFASDLLHEAVHLMQDEAKDRESTPVFFMKHLVSKSYCKAGPYFADTSECFHEIEGDIFDIIKKYNPYDESALKDFLTMCFSDTYRATLRKNLRQIHKDLNHTHPDNSFEKNMTYKIIRYYALREKEAIEKGEIVCLTQAVPDAYKKDYKEQIIASKMSAAYYQLLAQEAEKCVQLY